MKNDRIKIVDVIKGICCILVILLHFLLLIDINGYVGWSCLPQGVSNPKSFFFSYFPYSLFVNSSSSLYCFMLLIAFIPSYKFFKDKNKAYIVKSIFTRYFRFLPLVLFACILSYLFYKFDLYYFDEVYRATGNTWIHERSNFNCDFFTAVTQGIYSGYIFGSQLVMTFWCLHYLFLGSLLTYVILLAISDLKNRKYAYIFLILFLYKFPAYLSFISGIIVADIYANKDLSSKRNLLVALLFVGIVLCMFPVVLSPSFIPIELLYAIGGAFIVLSIVVLFDGTRLSNNKILAYIGKESFSFIVAHTFVLCSISSYVFIHFGILPAFISYIILSLILSIVFSFIINPITIRLCKFAEKAAESIK